METKNDIVRDYGLQETQLPSVPFPLYSAIGQTASPSSDNQIMTVFIEGDGYAWIDRHSISPNPTPKNPVALRMMTQSALKNGVNTLYLARPCQYIHDAAACTPRLWTTDRFSKDVIDSYMAALDILKQRYKIQSFHLVGYSGGGYIALVLSALRDDITQATTVAGLLDPREWTDYHHLTALNLSSNKTDDLIRRSAATHFTHYCGTDDKVAPCSLTENFIATARSLGLNNHSLVRTQNANHDDVWQMMDD